MVPSGRYGKTGHGSLPRRHGAPSRRSLRVSDTRRCRRAGAPARTDASCMYEITGAHTVVRDAGPGWDVEYRPYELGSDCSVFGETPRAA
jgi:hypothetical protein